MHTPYYGERKRIVDTLNKVGITVHVSIYIINKKMKENEKTDSVDVVRTMIEKEKKGIASTNKKVEDLST